MHVLCWDKSISCSHQTCSWTQKRCRRRPLCWLLCHLLQSKTRFCWIPPELAVAGTPETELPGECFPGSSAHAGVKGHKRLIIPYRQLLFRRIHLAVFGKDTLMTTAKRSSAVAGIFWQAVRMSWIVVWRSFRSDVIVLWFTERRKIDKKEKTSMGDWQNIYNRKIKKDKSVYFWLQEEPWLNLWRNPRLQESVDTMTWPECAETLTSHPLFLLCSTTEIIGV